MTERVPRFSRRGLIVGVSTMLMMPACTHEEETPVFEAATCLAELPEMEPPVSDVEASLAVSPDGRRVASLSTVTGVLTVWDAANGDVVERTENLGGFHLQFLGEERLVFQSHHYLVSIDLDGQNPSSLETGHEPRMITDLGTRTINALAVLGDQVVTVGADSRLGVFRPATCERAELVDTTLVAASGIAPHGADAVVVAAARSGPVRFRRGSDDGEELVAGMSNSYLAAFSADGTRLAVSGDRGATPVLVVLDADTWAVLHEVEVPSRAMSLDSHEDLWAATTHTQPPALVLLDTATGQQRSLPLPERTFAARFLPDGTLLTAHAHQGVLRWDPATGEQLAQFESSA